MSGATRETRSWRAVPRPVLLLLALGLGSQLAWQTLVPATARAAGQLGPAPPLVALQLASLGDPIALSKLLMFQLQAADSGAGGAAYSGLDFVLVEQWLERIADLDPRAQYPLLAASHLYAEVNDPARQRRMLDFVHRRFLDNPALRWRPMAHAVMVAKHRLRDLPLALAYARDLRAHGAAGGLPAWAGQLELLVLEDMGEIDSARIVLGGMIASGELNDPSERRFLERCLEHAMTRKAP